MNTKGIEFMDLIKELAAKFNLEMPDNFHKSETSKNLREEMMAACQKAAEYYNDALLNKQSNEADNALDYLKGRSISREIIKKFSLGIAPKGTEDGGGEKCVSSVSTSPAGSGG